jgi:hypothetical protein
MTWYPSVLVQVVMGNHGVPAWPSGEEGDDRAQLFHDTVHGGVLSWPFERARAGDWNDRGGISTIPHNRYLSSINA